MTLSIHVLALAILNDDREAAGFPPVESRDNIPDSDGYVRNARAVLAAIDAAGWAVVPKEASVAMEEAGIKTAGREAPKISEG